jgi:hypothetical protein
MQLKLELPRQILKFEFRNCRVGPGKFDLRLSFSSKEDQLIELKTFLPGWTNMEHFIILRIISVDVGSKYWIDE